MQTVRGLIFFLMLAVSGGVSVSQSTRPAALAEQQALTPRGALRLLNQAMREGDVPTIRRLFLTTSDAERKMVDADAGMAAALADLRRAAASAFGPEGAGLVTGDSGAALAESAARIDSAEIAITADTATVTYKDEKESPFVLKKVDGQWKVPVAELGKPLDPAALEQRLADLSAQRTVVLEITHQIEHGKFTTAEQAREAWRSRILQAATSQPTTRPAGG